MKDKDINKFLDDYRELYSPQDNHHARLLEYDDWARGEVVRYNQRLNELIESHWIEEYRNNKMQNDTNNKKMEETSRSINRMRRNCDITLEDALRENQNCKEIQLIGSDATRDSVVFQSDLTLPEKNIYQSSISGMKNDVYGDIPSNNSIDSIPWDSIVIDNGKMLLCKNITRFDDKNEINYVEQSVLFRLWVKDLNEE